MVTSKHERLMQNLARLVQFQVAHSGVELLVLDHMRLRVAKIAENVVVQVETAFVDAFFALALAAHAQNRLELSQFLHF